MDAGADVCVTSVHKMGAGLEQASVFHLQGDLIDPAVLAERADLLGTTSPSVLIYAALDGWRRQMVERGRGLFGAAIDLANRLRESIEQIEPMHVNGAEFVGPGLAVELDPLPIVVDIDALDVTGYSAADWLRSRHRINLHLSDHRRISAQITHADDQESADKLLTGLRDLVAHAEELRPAARIDIPAPAQLRLEQVHMPRDAFFGRTEQVPVAEAAGRIVAEMLTPYPPGIPAAVPGERLNRPVIDYLRSGVEAGMVIPDAADPKLESVRVLVEDVAAD
jgi:arginine/lysine/ornithine decarboxylase